MGSGSLKPKHAILADVVRKPTSIIACLIAIILTISALVFYVRAPPATAPDVKVTVVGITNTSRSAYKVGVLIDNRSRHSILILGVTINANLGPGTSPRLIGSALITNLVGIRAGATRIFTAQAVSLEMYRWSGELSLIWDAPEWRLRDWILRRAGRKYFPQQWLHRKPRVYIFKSPIVVGVPLQSSDESNRVAQRY
jgi:hypothetical protein